MIFGPEQLGKGSRRVRVVFDDENPQRLLPRHAALRSLRSRDTSAFGERRELDDERGAPVRAGALRLNGPPMQLDERSGDGETEPQAGLGARAGGSLLKRIEDARQQIGRYANSGIAHRNAKNSGLGVLGSHGDGAALRSEFRRVLQEIPEYLLDS